jgi:hypothetical protein
MRVANPNGVLQQSALFAILAAALAACEGRGTIVPAAPTSTAPSPTGVVIAGLAPRLPIGTTAQLSAFVALSNGTQKLLAMDDVTWQSSDATVVTVTSGGLATVAGLGHADVQAAFRDMKGTARVVATIDVSGMVHETPPLESVPVAGARVVIVSGARDGESTLTDADGRFTFRDIDTLGFALRASRYEFEDGSYTVSALPRDQHPDIALNPLPLERTWSGRFDGHVWLTGLNESFPFETHRPGAVTIAIHADCSTASTVEPLGMGVVRAPDNRVLMGIVLGSDFRRDSVATQVLPPDRYVVRVSALPQTRQGCPWQMSVRYPR